ncbi:hypothetical protein [Paenibacillus foliorum]|nr:hypothetical protein [Paenibacillus foliorum]
MPGLFLFAEHFALDFNAEMIAATAKKTRNIVNGYGYGYRFAGGVE